MKGGFITILATAMACVVVACGDDDASDATERASGADAAAETTEQAFGADVAADAADPHSTDRIEVDPATADGVTPPDGPKKMLGSFGRAPTGAERAAISAAIERYHAAVAAHDDAWICAHVSRAARRAMTGNAPGGRCEDQIDIFYSGHSDAIRKAVLKARIYELRVEGNHAIAIAAIPGPRTLRLPMERERGAWRYGTFGKWTPPSS